MRHNKRRKEEEALRLAYENARETLKRQYTKSLWKLEVKNVGNLSKAKERKIWKQALRDIERGVI